MIGGTIFDGNRKQSIELYQTIRELTKNSSYLIKNTSNGNKKFRATMKKLFSKLTNLFKTKTQNFFIQQFKELTLSLSSTEQEQLLQSQWLLCIDKEANGLQQLLQNDQPASLHDSYINNKSYFSRFHYDLGSVVHQVSDFPDDNNVMKQLQYFYQENVLNKTSIILSFVSPHAYKQQSDLFQSIRQWQDLLRHASIETYEFRIALVGFERSKGFHRYISYCQQQQQPLWIQIDDKNSLKVKLQYFEAQRRDCLLKCAPDDYLSILSFIALIIQLISKLQSGLMQVMAKSSVVKVRYYLLSTQSYANQSNSQINNPLFTK